MPNLQDRRCNLEGALVSLQKAVDVLLRELLRRSGEGALQGAKTLGTWMIPRLAFR